jgi:xanthine dehydrogenase small subunit
VLVEGRPRVACVTPVRRVAGRSVTTADGLQPEIRDRLTAAFVRHGASQCGFCTPGILCRLAALGEAPTVQAVENALLAHLCRCTGWRTILDAAAEMGAAAAGAATEPGTAGPAGQDNAAAQRRAAIEGRTAQAAGARVVLGGGGFADDTAPDKCLVAVPDGRGGWVVGETLDEARAAAGKVQGRRSGRTLQYPLEVPPGDWDLTLQTTWVEPGYLEPDASWCVPGGQPASPVGNGGAFGGKVASPVQATARELADRWGRPVRVLFTREDAVRYGPKRPPMAAGVRRDGAGAVRVATAPGITHAVGLVAPGWPVEEVEVKGPPVSTAIRGAGWAEAAVLMAAIGGRPEVTAPDGGWARAEVSVDAQGWPSEVHVAVRCGAPLDESVLRSYVTGAAHMALGWVCSEGVAVDPDGVPEDLTIRSFGILRARETPPIRVTIEADDDPPINGSDAAFAAVAAATWMAQGLPPRWPTRRGRTG